MNTNDKTKYLRQADSLKNGTARQMGIASSIATLINTVVKLEQDNADLRRQVADLEELLRREEARS